MLYIIINLLDLFRWHIRTKVSRTTVEMRAIMMRMAVTPTTIKLTVKVSSLPMVSVTKLMSINFVNESKN